MFAEKLSARLSRSGIHYAWVIAAVAFVVMLSTAAALGIPSVMLQPLGKEFGWNPDMVSSALALRFVLFGLMAPFSALLMERFGLQRVVCTALALIACAMGLSLAVTEFWQLVALWGVMLGIGTGMTALVLGALVATRWFTARRGLVIGLLTASSATGQLLFLPLAAWLVDNFGWRAAIAPVVVTSGIACALVLMFLRNRPSDLGLLPFGEHAPNTPVGSAAGVSAVAPALKMNIFTPFIVFRDAARIPTFWVLAGTFFICGLSTNGLIQTHFISLCGDYGLAALPAASVLAMIGFFDFIGTVGSGWLSDRFDTRKLLFWYYGLRGLSLFWLPHSTFTLYGLSFFAIFYGLDWIATVPPTVKLAGAAFGRERAPLVFGWIFASHQVGAAVAAYGAGLSRTVLLSYTPALYTAGAACVIAAVSVMFIKRQQPAIAAAQAK